MEGSVAAGTPGEGGQETTSSGGVDFTPLMEHLDGRLDAFRELLDERAPASEPQAEPADEWMEQFGHLFEQPQAEVEPEPLPQQESQALQALQALAQQSQSDRQMLAQMAQRVEMMEQQGQAQVLMEQYPELRDPEVARGAMDEAIQVAQQLGVPQLAGSAGFVGLIYKASRADALAQSGVPAGGDALVQLEAPGGAGPAPSSDGNEGQRIVNAMGGGGLWGRTGL